ncbi:UNVERIFIED_CONTAM: Retrovirus-related Pol polyprotein from transposon opus [Sesamum latifolium]|uniref:Retrovirus-related Pol polyprotein from transposon opus n=1 Tax=Sesamum latifolium TaxID=2727402 RepID=A0AAW2XNL3_9LAMI
MQLTMEDMVSTALFHVIDAKTSYNMLLGRPWFHENSVVPSTWHQCFKYYCNGIVKKVFGDNKPFTEAESHFADAKYYIEGAKKEKETQINLKQPLKPPLKRFVPSTQEEEGEHEVLTIDEKEFDPKTFKLLVKAGYNPKEKLSLGKLSPEATGKKLHGLNATQIMLKERDMQFKIFELGPRRRMGYQKKCVFKVTTYSKKNAKSSPIQKFRILIPSRMRRQTTLVISCGKILKVKAQIMVFTQVQSDDEDDRESVASFNYISNGAEEDFAQIYHVTLIEEGKFEEDAEDAPIELEEGVKATIDELKEVNLGDTEDPRPIYTSASLTQEEEEVKYPMWISSIVPVRKMNGQIRVCVDFRDLNNAYPKDDFPLPIAELMIDATTAHEALSFMDGSSGYNQIRMAPIDEELTVFRTPKGIYCYKVMPFGLKNAGAIYQRAMQRIFDDMLYKNVECYVDTWL